MAALSEKQRALIDKWIEELWRKGNDSAVDELHSKYFIDRSPSGRNPNSEGFKNAIKELYEAFPDFYTNVDDLIFDSEQQKVVIRWEAKGTHKGSFLGYAPTGRKITFRGIDILKLKGDQIVERWGEWDGLDIIAQLRADNEIDFDDT